MCQKVTASDKSLQPSATCPLQGRGTGNWERRMPSIIMGGCGGDKQPQPRKIPSYSSKSAFYSWAWAWAMWAIRPAEWKEMQHTCAQTFVAYVAQSPQFLFFCLLVSRGGQSSGWQTKGRQCSCIGTMTSLMQPLLYLGSDKIE